jgi:hypothetical protein
VTAALHTAFAEASHAGWLLCAACGLGVAVLGLLTTGGWARATAARTARLVAGADPH